jgi:hypothetical protein
VRQRFHWKLSSVKRSSFKLLQLAPFMRVSAGQGLLRIADGFWQSHSIKGFSTVFA